MSGPMLGIDLGTTNSSVAYVDSEGRAQIIESRSGELTVPSVVCIASRSGESDPHVGYDAVRLQLVNPQQTVFGVKRFIGRNFDEAPVRRLAQKVPYQIRRSVNGDAWVAAGKVERSPQEISAKVLAELKAGAEAKLGVTLDRAIITVPAHFDHRQRQATMDAAEIAGLKVERLINEPTAAALGFGDLAAHGRRVAVCDLGGGTFDVSIVNVGDGVVEVLATNGDLFLGGDDIDRVMVARMLTEVFERHRVDLADDATAIQRLLEECTAAKHILSGEDSAEIYVPSISHGEATFDFERRLTREELESWAEPVVRRLDVPCREAAAACGTKLSEIDAVLLVGGGARMPLVRERIAELFGRAPIELDNPEEVVALGAARMCAVLEGRAGGAILLDVASRTVGLSLGDGRYDRVIPRNATIPTREHRLVRTTEDGQRELIFDVYEGEFDKVSRNRLLGRFACSGLPDSAAGDVVLVVELTFDVDGILHVSVSELASGEPTELRLVATPGLSRSEVRRLSKSLAG